jgi:hypothetical protein
MRRARVAAAMAVMLAASCRAQPQADRKPAQIEIEKAVDEFKSLTRELGLRGEGSKHTKSPGFSAWHGRLFENFRNDFLDAIPHEVRQRGARQSTLRRNQFGFNVAGPVVIPRLYRGGRRTFFSLSYEGVRENVARSLVRTVPTLAERTGDWSSSVDMSGNPLAIYDPATTWPNPRFDASLPVSTDNLEYGREPFPESVIPRSRLDAVAQKALEYYPAPNTDVGPYFRNNYFIHSPETNTADGMIGKVDHNVRERHRVGAGFAYSSGALGAARWFPTAGNPGPTDRSFESRRGSVEHVFTVSPRTVNTLSFEASAERSFTGAEDTASYPAALGLAGDPGRPFPVFTFSSEYLWMGQSAPVGRNVRNLFTWSESLSTRRGKHNLRLAAQYWRNQVNSYWPSSPSGNLSFSSGLTSLPGITNTGHGFASFLLGMAGYGERSVVGSPSYFRNTPASASIRDSYEIRPGLTISAGLNLNAAVPRTEKYNRQSTVDLGTLNPVSGAKGALIVAARGGVPRAFQSASVLVEPSASLAWNPGRSTRTVVRASFSRSYGGYPLYFGQWGTQGFNGTPTFISPNVQLEPAATLSAGFPAIARTLPDLSGGAANDTTADLFNRSGSRPTYQSATLSLERELPGAALLSVGAAHNGGRNLYVGNGAANPNAVPLAALEYRDALNDESFNRSLRPYPQYKGFDLFNYWPQGRYQRDACFVRLEKRASQGLTLSASYEFSKQMDDYSGWPGVQDFFKRSNEWALTAWNSPHRVSLSYVYELPFGASKPFLNYRDWRRHLMGGWSLSGMTTVASGDPLMLRPAFNNTGGVVKTLYVDVVPGVSPNVPNPGPELWFNTSAFAQPADFTTGNGSRTHPALRNPMSQNHDLSLNKRFELAADRAVEFTAVGLNFPSHANWEDPDTVIGPASAPNANAGRIIGSRGGRVIQLGLRFTF